MLTNRPSGKRKGPNMRAMLDYFMALLMLFFGVFIIFSEKIIGYDYFADSSFVTGKMKWLVGILFMLYGIFRAYRGYVAATIYNENNQQDEA